MRLVIWLAIGCSLVAGCGIDKYFSVGHSIVPTGAMRPAIEPGDHIGYMIVKTTDTEFVERFDIVVFEVPAGEVRGFDEKSKFVMRVVAREGETVELRKGVLFVNGSEVVEPFPKIASADDYGPITVPARQYFVLGDNRPDSLDSRRFKSVTVKRENLSGIVTTIIRKDDWDRGKRW